FMRSSLLLVGLASCLLAQVEPNDISILKTMLGVAADAKTSKDGFDSATRSRIQELAKGITNAELRANVAKLDVEAASRQQAQVRFLLAEVKRLKGKAIT